MYCPKCRADVRTEVREISETYPVKGENIEVKAQVRTCQICGEAIWDDKLDAQNLLNAYEKYREKHGLLQPDEIREIREKYGLSQVAFAKVLGLGDKTITRYENGSIADMAQNNLIVLAGSPGNFKRLLERDGLSITREERNTAYAAVERLRCRVSHGQKGRIIFSHSDTAKVEFNTATTQYWGDNLYA